MNQEEFKKEKPKESGFYWFRQSKEASNIWGHEPFVVYYHRGSQEVSMIWPPHVENVGFILTEGGLFGPAIGEEPYPMTIDGYTAISGSLYVMKREDSVVIATREYGTDKIKWPLVLTLRDQHSLLQYMGLDRQSEMVKATGRETVSGALEWIKGRKEVEEEYSDQLDRMIQMTGEETYAAAMTWILRQSQPQPVNDFGAQMSLITATGEKTFADAMAWILRMAGPIPLLLWCPDCGTQHIDKPNPEEGWNDRPHKSHLCEQCGHKWRICDIDNKGVSTLHSVAGLNLATPPRWAANAEKSWKKVKYLEGRLKQTNDLADQLRRDINQVNRDNRALEIERDELKACNRRQELTIERYHKENQTIEDLKEDRDCLVEVLKEYMHNSTHIDALRKRAAFVVEMATGDVLPGGFKRAIDIAMGEARKKNPNFAPIPAGGGAVESKQESEIDNLRLALNLALDDLKQRGTVTKERLQGILERALNGSDFNERVDEGKVKSNPVEFKVHKEKRESCFRPWCGLEGRLCADCEASSYKNRDADPVEQTLHDTFWKRRSSADANCRCVIVDTAAPLHVKDVDHAIKVLNEKSHRRATWRISSHSVDWVVGRIDGPIAGAEVVFHVDTREAIVIANWLTGWTEWVAAKYEVVKERAAALLEDWQGVAEKMRIEADHALDEGNLIKGEVFKGTWMQIELHSKQVLDVFDLMVATRR